jgi:predicted negative regulator of RcsB-dependent stress response
MTSPRTDSFDSKAADRAQTFLDWTRLNSTALTAGAVVVLVAAGGFWFYQRSRQIQSANAEKALMNAKQSLTAGNMELAQTDLQSVYSRYQKTQAGVEAAMLLAQISYDNGKPQDGISTLEKVVGSAAAPAVHATVLSLEADGYSQLGKLTDAAKRYEAAAAATTMPLEQGYYKSKAARTYQAAGDTATARKLWTELASDPAATTMAPEAKVRLGELTATPVKQ